MTIVSLATELSQAFQRDKRNDGTEFVKLKDGSPQWMTDVIHAVHGAKLPDDTVYKFIEECADAIANLSDDASEDVIREALDQIEPDIYTAELTRWLAARTDHYDYCDRAIEEGLWSPKSDQPTISLLQIGQLMQYREVGGALYSELEKQAAMQEENA